jgi:osmotically-inducible protein OsmY
VECQAWKDDPELDGAGEPVAILVVAPLPGTRVARAVRIVLDRVEPSTVPAFAVVPDHTVPGQIRMIYSYGATAVIEWPRERRVLPFLLAELIGMLQVRPPAKGEGQALARSVRARLRLSPDLSTSVKIEGRGDVIRLAGEVDALWKKHKLEDIVAGVPGVRSVRVDDVSVVGLRIRDREIARSIRRVIRDTSTIDESTLSTSVESGRVTLAGTVEDQREVRRVIALLSHVRGVRHIENLATLDPAQKRADSAIARRLQKLLSLTNPEQKVGVAVFGGVAVLSGRVRSLNVKRRLGDLVQQEEGLVRLINKIEVGKS